MAFQLLSPIKWSLIRIGSVGDHDQWERNSETRVIKTSDFLSSDWRQERLEQDTWAYYDYKYMSQSLKQGSLELFSWASLGLENRDGHDSTLWMGTQGCHTACHQDSYGCNLVCQVQGQIFC